MYNKKVLQNILNKLDSAKAPANKKDIIIDPRGQWEYPGEITRIPGNETGTDITMAGVPYPVYGEDNTGYGQMMYPDENYTFPGEYVDEYPQMDMAKKGGSKKSKKYSKSLLATNKLFKKNPLFKKKKYKGKTYDPQAMYFESGGALHDCNNPPPTPEEVQKQVLALGLGPTIEGAKKINTARLIREEWEIRCRKKQKVKIVAPPNSVPIDNSNTNTTQIQRPSFNNMVEVDYETPNKSEITMLDENGRVKTTIQYYDVPSIGTLPLKKVGPIQNINIEQQELLPTTTTIKRWDSKANKWIEHQIPYNSPAAERERQREEWRLKNFEQGGLVKAQDGGIKGDQAKRFKYLYEPLHSKILDSDLILNNYESYPLRNQVILENYFFSEPEKDDNRTLPPLTPELRELQNKLLSASDKELNAILKIDWSKMSSIPEVMKKLPKSISYKDALNYMKHLKTLESRGYTLRDGGYIVEELPKAQNGGPYNTAGPAVEQEPVDDGLIEYLNSKPQVYGHEPEDYNTFLAYSETAPENRRPYGDYVYGQSNDYDHYGMWEALGKPKNFEEALQMNPDWEPDPYDGYYHGFSVNPYTGVFLKSGKPGFKPGDTTFMEIAGHYLSPRAQMDTPVFDIDLQRFRYIPNRQYGGSYNIGDEIDEFTKNYLEGQGYTFEEI